MDDEMARLKAWLPAQDPRTWHKVALSWNWDSGTELLDWILDQPDCDRGTAIAIYCFGEPDYYADKFETLDEMRAAGHWGLRTAEFLVGICRRWEAGAFPNYRFHPGNWTNREQLWAEVPPGMIRAKAPWPVPESMSGEWLRGEAVDSSDFTEGMPNIWFAMPEDKSEARSLFARFSGLFRSA